ncbi:ammonium transporter [Mesoterricola silvestris]|uniref:Ammonium transporter n=1 Tax=Mesoterricola silvestris TaxID=2927979 RepID=A0AA48GUH7_9BACT|nr:ammonium transporter [Mesoterricola silvestris]BDU74297.1 ammonium transporter [Mesoterricola silvestris]
MKPTFFDDPISGFWGSVTPRNLGRAGLLLLAILLLAPAAFAGDPGGGATGGIQNVPAQVQGKPTLQEVGAALGQTRVALNFVWVLVAGFLVMFMQAGFALAETGFTRAKNASHTMMMNLMVYAVGILGFWVCGFALQMGGSGAAAGAVLSAPESMGHLAGPVIHGNVWGLFGTRGFLLTGQTYDVSAFAMFLFQMVFMDTALTIPTGAMAERWKLSTFMIYGLVGSTLIYPVYACWAWGGGWLSQLGRTLNLGHGYVDFAGSGVVHLTGGVMAFTGALILGPRLGKFVKGKAQALPGHNLPMAFLGCFILAFGWFGFNAGSTLAGTDLRIAVVAVNTMLASAAGATSAYLYTWIRYGSPDPSMSANGLLAGLVAVTAPCAFIGAPAAILVGLVAGVLVVVAALFVENTLKIDDPVGAIAVHGANGIWGLLALGLFADGTYGQGLNNGPAGGVTGLLYGDPRQLLAQVAGIAANLVYVGAASFVLFKVLDKVIGLRVAPEVELQGLDFHEVSAPAYPGEGQLIGSSVLVFEKHPPRPAAPALSTAAVQEARS